jgi:signal peptidase II
MKRFFIPLLLIVALAVDRLTKMLVLDGWNFQFGILRLERFDNHGLVFSIPTSPLIAIVSTSLVILGLLIWMIRARTRLRKKILVAALCILIGAISNLTDRILYSVVIDWITFGRWFPIFNLADVVITFGVLLWVSDLTNDPHSR